MTYPNERYYQLYIESDDPERWLPTSWNVISELEALPARIKGLEATENVRVTKVHDQDTGKEVELPWPGQE